jgi:short-subunit dehydrogenase
MTTRKDVKPRALVTGASSGIGAAFATRLARDGYDLVLVARRQDRLKELARNLRETHGVNVEILGADLTKANELRAVEAHVAGDPVLSMLVNNAGFGAYRSFLELDPDLAEKLINLQVLAVTRLTRAALHGMIARGQGAIINVSSRLAFSGPLDSPQIPRRATYAATKSFINTFTQILANELEGTSVRVQALCPGVVRTEFHLRQGIDPSRFPDNLVMDARELVDASLAGLQLGEVICIPALQDDGLLAQFNEIERQILQDSGQGQVAPRYLE